MGSSDRGALVWTGRRPSTPELDREQYEVFSYPVLHRDYIEPAQQAGLARRAAGNPAQPLLDLFAQAERVAVLNVPTGRVRELHEVYGYVVEPALRRGCRLLVGADAELADLDAGRLADPGFGYAWTLDRLHYLADGGVPGAITQIIAPAGGGKTTQIVEETRRLIADGVPADRILCVTLNAATRLDLAARLAEPAVAVHTPRTLGWHILGEAGLQRPLKRPPTATLRRLAAQAARELGGGERVEAGEAADAIARYKLVDMVDPGEAIDQADDDLATATIYRLYQELLDGAMDADDQLLEPVQLLSGDAAARRTWQERWTHVLADEYQDFEPAAELLVQILAAPQDALTVAGDDDEGLAAWRWLGADHLLALDQRYPGLERRILETSYRPADVVTRSTRLIEHNQRRLPKTIVPARFGESAITVRRHRDERAATAWAAEVVSEGGWKRGGAAVLARTTRLLRAAGLALAEQGVRFDGPEVVFTQPGALGTVAAGLRLLADPTTATEADVTELFRLPARLLPAAAVTAVTAALRGGSTFTAAVGDASAGAIRRAQLLDELVGVHEARTTISRLREEGGLDAFYAEHEQLAPTERVELETLDALERWAAGQSVAEAARALASERDTLMAHRDPAGIELLTIHAARGREWPQVVLVDGETAESDDDDETENERRIAYVAFTRTTGQLHVAYEGEPSRFLVEAGLAEGRPQPVVLTPVAAPRKRRTSTRGARPKPQRVGGAVGGLIARLESNSIDERRAAAFDLGFVAPHPEASKALAVALSDRDLGVRQAAATTLGKVGDRDALPALQQRLTEEREESARSRARMAIGQIERRTDA